MKRKGVKAAPAAMAGDDNEEELSLDDEEILSASEEEEDASDDERRHTKLLEAISSLGGRRRMKQKERSEASLQVSEFSVSADGAGEKVDLSDLLGDMEKTPGATKKTKKQLKNLQNRKETLELPLSKQQTEKIHRGVAFEKSSKEVSRWESVITQNQKAEQLVFPLRQEPTGHKRVDQVVAGWKAKTPLEQEIFSLLHSNNQPVLDPVLTEVEEASIKAMSLEEAKMRRAELQKARALQSYYESKARRERKIKSKKYHKVQKKSKRKEFLKQFDELMKMDPDGALEELKKMELSRMEERMSLKHQNSGKWAKSKAIMAKYDDSARKAMQEQLEKNKELTMKLVLPSSDEEEEEKNDEDDALPDFVNDPEPIAGSVNPWMRGKLTKEPEPSTTGTETSPLATKDGQSDPRVEKEEEEEEEMETEEEKLLREFESKRKLRQDEDDDLVPVPREEKQNSPVEAGGQVSKGEEKVTDEGVTPFTVIVISEEEEEEEQEEEEEEEEEVVSEFNSLFNRLMNRDGTKGAEQSGTKEAESVAEEEELLEEGLVRVQTMDDIEALEQDAVNITGNKRPPAASAAKPPASEPPNKKKKKEIDLSEVLTKDAKVVKVALAPTMLEEEEEVHTEQTAIIKEAFAGDDVISDFLKEKRKQEEAGREKAVDLTLPGWGEWGGVGLKPSRYKRRKFRLKAPPAPPRKDQKRPDVIISEKRNVSVAAHQVSVLPFPFQNSSQFESCIRSPVGQTWNTQIAFKKLTAPRVVTQLGAIIDPMSREDLLQENHDKTQRTERTGNIALSEKRGNKGKGEGRKTSLLKKKKKKKSQQ